MNVPRDTAREAYAHQVAVLRRMAPEERMRIALEMSDQVRAIVKSGLRDRHRHASEGELQRLFEGLILGTESGLVARRPAPARGR